MARKNKAPSLVEQAVALTVLALMAGMAYWVWSKQFDLNPALLAGPKVMGVVQVSQSKPPASPPSKAGSSLLKDSAGLTALSLPEFFDQDSLSDKIDGKAELYLSSGFKELKTQRFSLNNPDDWFEIFIYDMAADRNAFAVFSGQRRAEAKPVPLTALAYLTSNSLFFAQNRFYVEIVASKADPTLITAMSEAAKTLIASFGGQGESLAEPALFPTEGLEPGSIRLTVSNVFGFEGLSDIFTADYRFPQGEASAFLSKRANPAEAEKMALDYAAFLLANGGKEEPGKEGSGQRVINIADTYEIIFTRGSFLAGVHGAENKPLAVELVEKLAKKMDGINP